MNSDTRKARMASLFADEAPELVKLLPKEKTQEEKNAENAASREAEAVLALLRRTRFEKKICKECTGDFLTDYACVAYCSDRCRRAALRKFGIAEWDPAKPSEERWGYPIPLVIPPALMDHLRKCLDLPPLQPEVEKPEQYPAQIEPQNTPSVVEEYDLELDPSIFDVLHT